MICNRSLAACLSDYADLLEQQGRDGLEALPHVGPAIARVLEEMIDTGRWQQLERLRSELRPEQLFKMLPGIGPRLAARMATEAGLETL